MGWFVLKCYRRWVSWRNGNACKSTTTRTLAKWLKNGNGRAGISTPTKRRDLARTLSITCCLRKAS